MNKILSRNEAQIQAFYSEEERVAIDRWMHNCPAEVDTADRGDSNLVARIVLLSIRHTLPEWVAIKIDGGLVRGRNTKLALVSDRDALTKARHLLTINWADSGPGYSWPEAYYATLLPGYNIYVVTASQDSVDAYGVADIALDYFKLGQSTDYLKACKNVIETWWSNQSGSCEQHSWQEVWDTGLISLPEAEQMKSDIWGEETELAW